MTWDFACPDWENRLREGRSLIPDLPLDDEQAARAVRIFDKLRLPDVPDQPPMAEAAGDWFRDIVRTLFGSLDPETKQRHVAEIFALIAKKNNKTTGGAAIMLTALLVNDRPRAEHLFIGPTMEVADIAFSQAAGMIDADPYLRKRFHVIDHRKTIRDRTNRATLKILSFDMRIMVGAKPVGVLVDELHVISSLSYASRVIGQIRGGLLPNPEGFLLFITTQSDRPPAGVFAAELKLARAVRDGSAKGRMLPILYEFPEEMQRSGAWRDSATWALVNPNLGRSITLPRLIADYESAVEKGGEEERRWASQHLNIEIGLALHSDRWPGADYWEGRGDKTLTLEALLERSEVVVIGLDGGGLDDLFGLAVVGREKETRRWLHWGHAWAHESVLARRKSEAERLRDFEQDGDLTIVSDLGQDVEEIIARIEQIAATDLLPEKGAVGVDPIGIGQIVDALAERGIEGEQVVGISQGYKLNGAIKTAERKLADGTLTHAAQPIMAWAVGNAKLEQRGNAVLITKQAAGTAKIDPLIAMLNAVALMAMNPDAGLREIIYQRGQMFA